MKIERIQKVVANHFGISIEELLSKSRLKPYIKARQIAIWICKKSNNDWSFPYLAKKFNMSSHKSITYSYDKINFLHNKKDWIEDIKKILTKLGVS